MLGGHPCGTGGDIPVIPGVQCPRADHYGGILLSERGAELNDNESSIYNISLTVTIDNGQFFNMLNYVSQGNNPGYLYNLNSNNCTTFALTAL